MIMLVKRRPGIINYSSISPSVDSAQQIVKRIRDALDDIGSDWTIKNVKDVGYKMVRHADR